MKDRINQLFIVSSILFTGLIWYSLNSPVYYTSQDDHQVQEYMRKKISKILEKEEKIKGKKADFIGQRELASKDGNCLGCCHKKGGVLCQAGTTRCSDGSPLSRKCKMKGCSACPTFKER